MKPEEFSKYEVARILGARALQIAMNAPLLIKITQEDLEKIKFDALKIAEVEFESGILPISIKRPLPERTDKELRKAKVQQEKTMTDKEVEEKEAAEEEEIAKEGEIMELATPEDEREDEGEEVKEE